jgi:hypothetical protein
MVTLELKEDREDDRKDAQKKRKRGLSEEAQERAHNLLREEIKLCSLPTPEGERRAFIYSAAWAKQQEKDKYQTTENGQRNQE